jgi:hypothetical protein
MMLHAPLALLAVLFAYSLATASPEASGAVAAESPLVLMTFAALR